MNPSEVTPTVHVSSHLWQTSSTILEIHHGPQKTDSWRSAINASTAGETILTPPGVCFISSVYKRWNRTDKYEDANEQRPSLWAKTPVWESFWRHNVKFGAEKKAGRGKLKSSLESLIKTCKFCRCSVRWPGLGKQLVYSFTICLWSRDNRIDKLLLAGQL